MERVTNKTFDKKCMLLKNGFRISGNTDRGMVLSNTGVNGFVKLLSICSLCKLKGCSPSIQVEDKSAIIAKVS